MTIHVETPLWHSQALSDILGADVFLKMEALQPTGAFKARGMGAACRESVDAGATQLICSSGGNAGYAVAYAGRRLGVNTTIVVPKPTSQRSRDLIQQEGADLIEHGDAWDDAHRFAMTLAEDDTTAYIHPFDDPRVWRGHATMIHEIAKQGSKPDVMIVSVGGGGLLCGVLEGLHDVGWDDVPVLTTETAGAASFATSLRNNRHVTLETIQTVATTLGARRVTAEALAWAERHTIIPWLMSDRAAVDACLRFADDHRVLVEPACGAALSAVYDRAAPLTDVDSVVVIACGGAGVTLDSLRQWDKQVPRE